MVIGHEWDGTAQRDSYWVSYGGKCFLVAGTHMRHAEFEECLVHEKFIDELSEVFKELQRPDMQYTDVRKDQMDSGPLDQTGQENEGPNKGLMSRVGQVDSDSIVFFPARTPHAPSYTPDDGRPLSSGQGDPLASSAMPEPAQEPTPLSPLREVNNGILYAAT